MPPANPSDSQQEVFLKTLAFYCALIERGCLFSTEMDSNTHISRDEDGTDNECAGDEDGSESMAAAELYDILFDMRSRELTAARCNGQLMFRRDIYQRPFIQYVLYTYLIILETYDFFLRCERRKNGHRAHLILRNLNEFDLDYLQALIENNKRTIWTHEEAARKQGYGPLAPCNFFAAFREQKTLCRKLWTYHLLTA